MEPCMRIFALQGDDRIELINFRAGPLTFKTQNTERLRITSGGNVSIQNDSGKFTAGAGDDLQIYHDGHSKITNGAGHLYIDQDAEDGNIYLRSDDGSSGLTNYILCNGSTGAVENYLITMVLRNLKPQQMVYQ